MTKLPIIADAGDIRGKRVLLRLDLNTPVADGKITDTYRIDKVIQTIDHLHLAGARVIIIAHIETKENPTLLPVWHYINGFLPLKFCPTYFTPDSHDRVDELKDGEIMMFENIRMNPGEKINDPRFAQKLAAYGDIYINEAFSVSHRPHASVVGLPALLPHYAGPLFVEEVENLSKAFSPSHPFVFILGGAKFETKLPLIEKFLRSADTVFVGGALANNVFKEKGYELGVSLVSEGEFGIKDMLSNPKFIYPIDVTARKADGTVEIVDASAVQSGDYIADCGPKTIVLLKEQIAQAKFVLWNGPVGNYEIGFTDKTEQLAEIMSQSTSETIVGGGDTLSAIQSLGVMDKFSFVSTAGGAMLDFLANETLVGIQALM